jgi:hypothetical protein
MSAPWSVRPPFVDGGKRSIADLLGRLRDAEDNKAPPKRLATMRLRRVHFFRIRSGL